MSAASRLHRRHCIAKLADADGEQQESQHWIIVSVRSGYLDRETAGRMIQEYDSVGSMLGAMIQTARQSIKHQEKLLREVTSEYSANNDPLDDLFTVQTFTTAYRPQTTDN